MNVFVYSEPKKYEISTDQKKVHLENKHEKMCGGVEYYQKQNVNAYMLWSYDKCEKFFHDLFSITGLHWHSGILVATSIIIFIQFEIDFLSFACISLLGAKHIRTENQSSANLINPFACGY